MKNNILATGLILIGVISRLLPHEPNFTALGAIAIFSGVYLPRKYSLGVLLITMFISDIFLGFHPTIGWVYGSFILISLLSSRFKNVFLLPLMSSVLFFVMTNFGVFISGNMYTHNIKGLIECYILAIPFFRGTLLGDIFYTTAMFGGFNLVKNWQQRKQTDPTLKTGQVYITPIV